MNQNWVSSVRQEPSIVFVMPMFNEADTIEGTLSKILALRKIFRNMQIVIQDDCSTDQSVQIAENFCRNNQLKLLLESNQTNRKHGPTLRRALARACDIPCDIIWQVDSDGQFAEDDLHILGSILGVKPEAKTLVIVHRLNRTDPWVRRLITWFLTYGVSPILGFNKVRDANSPIRIWRRSDLEELLSWVGSDARTPNIMLTMLATRLGFDFVWVPLEHRERDSNSGLKTGTMFSSGNRSKVGRVLKFAAESFGEVLIWRIKIQIRSR